MKFPNTYNFFTAHPYDMERVIPVVDADFLLINDHIPYYDIDYNLTYEQKCAKYFGQNMYVKNCKNPEDTYFVYESYFNVEHPGNILYNYSFPETLPEETVQPKEKKYKFICMMNKPRMHRIITSSWINENFTSDEYFHTVNFQVEQDHINVHLQFIDPIYPGLPINFLNADAEDGKVNLMHNDKFMRVFYPKSSLSVFNIVTEPEFFSYGYHHSEKTDQAFLSYNIPIVHGYSACDSIKKVGVDMFEDIVDYSSQYIKDPFERTYRLLNDNKDVLKNAFDILTPAVRQRLEYNNQLIRSKDINKDLIYKLNDELTVETFKEIMYNTTNIEIKNCLQHAFRSWTS